MAEARIDIPTEVVITGTVIRCGCGDPESHSQLDPPRPCTMPRAVEALGRLGEDGAWHLTPLGD